MTKRFVLAVFVFFTASVCLKAQPAESAAREREEYAVYSAIIPEIYHTDEGGILVIANPTWRHTQISFKNFQFFYPAPVLSQETFDDFLERNRSNRWLERKLELDFAYIIADYADIKRLIDNPIQDWKDFFKHYPASHGFFHCSRVGFNQTMDQALVNAGWRCGGLCGHSEFILLIKKDGVWRVVNEANRVVS